jgi:hypothetical protein
MDLDSGVALRVHSPDLQSLRDELADESYGLLTSQDVGRWTPHVTIQNKVEPRVARTLLGAMRDHFEPRPLAIRGLELVRYLDGEWQPLGDWPFR